MRGSRDAWRMSWKEAGQIRRSPAERKRWAMLTTPHMADDTTETVIRAEWMERDHRNWLS